MEFLVDAVVHPRGAPGLLLLLGEEALQVGAGQMQGTLGPEAEGDWAGAGGAQATPGPCPGLHPLCLLRAG